MQKSFHLSPLSQAKAKLLRALATKKQRYKQQRFLLASEKVVFEALQTPSSYTVALIVAPEAWWEEAKWPASTMLPAECYTADPKEIEHWSGFQNYYGPLALLEMPEPTQLNPQHTVTLYLDRVQDPGNLGTIMRLADWYGLGQVLLSKGCADPYNPKTIAATMGSFLRVETLALSFEETRQALGGRMVYLADLKGQNVHTTPLQKPCVLVIGSESQGLSPEIKQSLGTERLSIPRFGQAESLNAAMSTGILLDNLMRS